MTVIRAGDSHETHLNNFCSANSIGNVGHRKYIYVKLLLYMKLMHECVSQPISIALNAYGNQELKLQRQ